MNRFVNRGAISPSVLLFAISLIAAVVWYVMSVTNQVVSAMLNEAFPALHSTHQAAWPNMIGGITASNISVGYDSEIALIARKINISLSPADWAQVLVTRKSASRIRQIDAFEFEILDVDSNGWAGFDGFGLFGDTSASPFEAEGCAQDVTWLGEELEQMGLDPGRTNYRYSWLVEGDAGISSSRLETAGVSTAEIIETYDIEAASRSGRDEDMQLTDIRVKVSDEGFVAARNNFCANNDGVSQAMVVERHLVAVNRNLLATGLIPSSQLISSYREFAGSGGNLSLLLKFDQAIALDAVQKTSDAFRGMTGYLAIKDRRAALDFTITGAVPIADSEAYSSTFEAMKAEGSLPDTLLNEVTKQLLEPVANPIETMSENSQTVGLAEQDAPAQAINGLSQQPQISSGEKPEAVPDPEKKIITNIEGLRPYINQKLWLYRVGRDPEQVRILSVAGSTSARVERKYASGTSDFAVSSDEFIRAATEKLISN